MTVPEDIIARMREQLEEHGWHQGELHAGHFFLSADVLPSCLQGAFNLVFGYASLPSPLGELARKETGSRICAAIRGLYPGFRCCAAHDPSYVADPWHVIVNFNDDKHTTCEDIMRVLKRAEQE